MFLRDVWFSYQNILNDKQDFKTSFINDESKKYLIENIKDIKIEKGSMKINEINVSDIAFVFKK